MSAHLKVKALIALEETTLIMEKEASQARRDGWSMKMRTFLSMSLNHIKVRWSHIVTNVAVLSHLVIQSGGEILYFILCVNFAFRLSAISLSIIVDVKFSIILLNCLLEVIYVLHLLYKHPLFFFPFFPIYRGQFRLNNTARFGLVTYISSKACLKVHSAVTGLPRPLDVELLLWLFDGNNQSN